MILKGDFHTHMKGWSSGPIRDQKGKTVTFCKWHPSVSEAIQVKFSNDIKYYVNYKDLLPLSEMDFSSSKNESFLFEPDDLVL